MDAEILQYIITGLTTGSIYALVAIGYVTIYNITGIINLAQGEFAMIGALSCISLLGIGVPMGFAILLAILITGFAGWLIERAVIVPSRKRKASFVVLIIITIGLSTLLRGIGLLIWGTYPQNMPAFTQNESIQILGAVLIPQSLWVFSTLLILLGVLYVFFEKTVYGSAVKACVINPRAAQLMGINTQAMSGFAFVLGATFGAVAGIVVAPMSSGVYDMGMLLGLKGFVAMAIGGMNSMVGVVLGGWLLGTVEAFSGGFISTAYSDAISFAILLFILFFSPNGLLGKIKGQRV